MTDELRDEFAGWRLYVQGQPITACANDAQRAGWMSANKAEAFCAVLDYEASRKQDGSAFVLVESSIEDDYAWIRTGC